MALAALAAGADGLLIEVHPDPDNALSDGAQSLDFDGFERLLGQLKRLAEPLGRDCLKHFLPPTPFFGERSEGVKSLANAFTQYL